MSQAVIRSIAFCLSLFWWGAVQVALGAAEQSALTAGPLQIAEPDFDFGLIERGTPSVAHKYSVRNNGNAPIKLIAARPDCAGCTLVRGLPQQIAPNTSGDVEVLFVPTGALGPAKHVVLVQTDNANQRLLRLSYSALVAGIGVVPSTVDFGQLAGGLRKTVPLTLRVYGKGDWRALDGKSNSKSLDVSVGQLTRLDPNSSEGPFQASVQLTLNSTSIEIGNFAAAVEIVARDRAKPDRTLRVRVPVTAVNLGGSVIVHPGRVFFGAIAGNETGKQKCRVVTSDGGAPGDLTAVSDDPHVVAVLSKEADATVLTVEFKPHAGCRGLLQGKLTLRDHGGAVAGLVPWMVYVR